jgi:hypothetical protein
LTTGERERLKLLERETRELRKANEILKAASVFSRRSSTGPRGGERVHRSGARALRCRAHLPHVGVSPSAYYQRATGERSVRAVEDERLTAQIRELHAANYHAYGARRMRKALRREARTSVATASRG